MTIQPIYLISLLLSEIAEKSGGRFFTGDESNAADLAAKIGIELRNGYLLGYTSTNTADGGKFRTVTVEIAAPQGLPPIEAAIRRGYYSPSQ